MSVKKTILSLFVFISDSSKEAIFEYIEWGEYFDKCLQFDGEEYFDPTEVISFSPDLIIVDVNTLFVGKVVFFREEKNLPISKSKKIC